MSLRPLAFSMLRTHLLACSFNHQRPACTFLAYCFFHAWATFESDEAGTSTRRTRSRASLGEAPTVHRFSSPQKAGGSRRLNLRNQRHTRTDSVQFSTVQFLRDPYTLTPQPSQRMAPLPSVNTSTDSHRTARTTHFTVIRYHPVESVPSPRTPRIESTDAYPQQIMNRTTPASTCCSKVGSTPRAGWAS
jgi:hypothetical protein